MFKNYNHHLYFSHYIDGKVSPFFKKRYEGLMDGCYKEFSKRECDATERARLEMSKEQPAKHHNYTEVGFKKIRVPKGLYNGNAGKILLSTCKVFGSL